MLLISLTILLSGGPAWAQTGLEQRLNSWPDWSLPVPLPRPSNRDDLIYPDWFAGLWQVESIDLDAPDDPPLLHQARFQADRPVDLSAIAASTPQPSVVRYLASNC